MSGGPPTAKLEMTYYVVSVRLLPVSTKPNSTLQGPWVYLSGEGFERCHAHLAETATRFTDMPSHTDIRSWSRDDWFNRHDLKVLPRIFRIKRIEIEEREEVI